jgi:hypothetical protein
MKAASVPGEEGNKDEKWNYTPVDIALLIAR